MTQNIYLKVTVEVLLIIATLFLVSCGDEAPTPTATPRPAEAASRYFLPGMEAVSELPFTTLAQGEVLTGYYPPRGAHLSVIAEPEDIGRLGLSLGEEHKDQLRALDFESQFAVVALIYGGPVSLEIQRVLRQGDFVTIYASYEYPLVYLSQAPLFHSIVLTREDLRNQELNFTYCWEWSLGLRYQTQARSLIWISRL